MSAPEVIVHDTGSQARVAITTRAGGVSTGSFGSLNLGASTADEAWAVRQNRVRVCDSLGIEPDRVSMCRQVHGSTARVAERPLLLGRFVGGLIGWPAGDALVTREVGLPLAVLGADCLPVLLWRRDEPAVAAAHAGWRGLVDGVIEAAVSALGAPDTMSAFIGPGIGAPRYEVDQAIADRFATRFGASVVRGRRVDLAAAARAALVGAGLPSARIDRIEGCTYEESERWFSHRRDGPATGRHAGIVWLEADA